MLHAGSNRPVGLRCGLVLAGMTQVAVQNFIALLRPCFDNDQAFSVISATVDMSVGVLLLSRGRRHQRFLSAYAGNAERCATRLAFRIISLKGGVHDTCHPVAGRERE